MPMTVLVVIVFEAANELHAPRRILRQSGAERARWKTTTENRHRRYNLHCRRQTRVTATAATRTHGRTQGCRLRESRPRTSPAGADRKYFRSCSVPMRLRELASYPPEVERRFVAAAATATAASATPSALSLFASPLLNSARAVLSGCGGNGGGAVTSRQQQRAACLRSAYSYYYDYFHRHSASKPSSQPASL